MLVYQSVSQMTNIYNLYNSRIDSLVMICEPFNKPNGSKWVIWVMFWIRFGFGMAFSWLARDYSFTLPRNGNPQPSTELCFFELCRIPKKNHRRAACVIFEIFASWWPGIRLSYPGSWCIFFGKPGLVTKKRCQEYPSHLSQNDPSRVLATSKGNCMEFCCRAFLWLKRNILPGRHDQNGCFRKWWVFPPKSSIYNRDFHFSIVHFGGFPPIFGNTQNWHHTESQMWFPLVPDRLRCLSFLHWSRRVMPRDTSRKVSQNSAWVPELTNTVDARVSIWFDKVLYLQIFMKAKSMPPPPPGTGTWRRHQRLESRFRDAKPWNPSNHSNHHPRVGFRAFKCKHVFLKNILGTFR